MYRFDNYEIFVPSNEFAKANYKELKERVVKDILFDEYDNKSLAFKEHMRIEYPEFDSYLSEKEAQGLESLIGCFHIISDKWEGDVSDLNDTIRYAAEITFKEEEFVRDYNVVVDRIMEGYMDASEFERD